MKNPFENYPDVIELRNVYEKKFNMRAPGILLDEIYTMEEYKKWLQAKIDNNDCTCDRKINKDSFNR